MKPTVAILVYGEKTSEKNALTEEFPPSAVRFLVADLKNRLKLV